MPYSISVLPKEFIEDIGATNLDDVTRYSAGVAKEHIGGFLGANDTAFLRGFRSRFLYDDGFLLEAVPSVNPSTLERVDVLKGPGSVLYGTMKPGGMINVVSKSSLNEPFFELTQRFGSWQYHEQSFDFGTPLFGSDEWLFRVNGGSRNNNSFRN